MKYDRPTWQLMGECAQALPRRFRVQQVVQWFAVNYPDIESSTVQTHVVGLTDSPTNSHQLSSRPPLFRRVGHGEYELIVTSGVHFAPEVAPAIVAVVTPDSDHSIAPDIVLVACVKSKQDVAAPAKELYTSALFTGARAAAEKTGTPWFILSAEHGLVEPDQWISPYDRKLSDQSDDYRAVWGAWVVTRLQTLAGDLSGKTIEVHAGDAYLQPIRDRLERAGAGLTLPLEGLTMGARLAYYAAETRAAEQVAGPSEQVIGERIVAYLTDPSRRVAATDVGSLKPRLKGHPGLYSWWVDADGARDLSSGLNEPVQEGVIYAGQAGASTSGDLWGRLTSMHLGKKATMSTFRLTLGSILSGPLGWVGPDDPRLSSWMESHLSVVALAVDDRRAILALEREVLLAIDPPLNLTDVQPTAVRIRLRELRKAARGASPT